MEKRATSKDVARLAGVSQATVSYVLNNKKGQTISQETRERVLRAARLLDYMPTHVARALQASRTNCIAVSVNKNVMLPRYGQVLEGARSVLDREGYRLLLCTDALSPSGYPDYLNRCILHRADGILYVGADGQEPLPSALEYILEHDIPFVAYDSCQSDPRLSSVNLDYYSGTKNAVSCFLSLGGKHLAYLRPCGEIDTPQELQREAGVRDAVADCPGATLEIFDDFFPGDARLDENFSFNFLQELGSSARNFFSSVVSRTAAGTRFVCSWGAWAQPLCSFLPPYDGFAPSVLSLAQSGSFPYGNQDPRILSCDLLNYTAGESCAKLLIRQLYTNGGAEKQLLCPRVFRPGVSSPF
ncbi:LacI family DNA-binding transcriptional regulator [Intestinimonas massiliensis (ex Afouda et al. 2020)]|uniref:LacI family DNA-binding transcriptional regulator n=1 Tax=Intestinimonas massiliensis (ex Afouda et al. 2020) TaxID=1673721 RepID=UPI0013EF0A55|nr:LacI family DNA-binding transcriptional regulator [Intestinimonas massiliensis (ex Afouda et al. 2020)]